MLPLKCQKCHRIGVKLWRDYTFVLLPDDFTCFECLRFGKDIDAEEEKAKILKNPLASIRGWYLPCVPIGLGENPAMTETGVVHSRSGAGNHTFQKDLEAWKALPLKRSLRLFELK